MEKPSVFVGSSTNGLEIARAVQVQLKEDALVDLWNEGAFGLGKGTLESLVSMLDRYDFAVLVMTPDDVLVSSGTANQAPRDNVMFELGLFMGRLGRSRTFGVCSNSGSLKLPSDLAGVTLARFDSEHAERNVVSALGPACFEIRQAIRHLGLSEAKQLHGIRDATFQVEGISDQVAHLVLLLARSRMLELEVTTKQFGAVLPDDFLRKLRQDLQDLEAATKAKEYVDDEVRYLGGHPRYAEAGRGTLRLGIALLSFDSPDAESKMAISKATVRSVYFEMQELGMEQAEYEEQVLISGHELLMRSTAVVNIRDPEDIHPEGLKVRFGFRNDYYAKVFVKRCSESFEVPSF